MNACIAQCAQHPVPTCYVRQGYVKASYLAPREFHLCARFALVNHCTALAYVEVQ